MSINRVIISGNLTRNPEQRTTGGGLAIANFSVAVSERFKAVNGEWQDRANFIDCTAFGKTAENICKFFGKGKPILIEGRLRHETWEDKQSGQKRSRISVIAEQFQFMGGDRADGQQGQQQQRQAPANQYVGDSSGGGGQDAFF